MVAGVLVLGWQDGSLGAECIREVRHTTGATPRGRPLTCSFALQLSVGSPFVRPWKNPAAGGAKPLTSVKFRAC